MNTHDDALPAPDVDAEARFGAMPLPDDATPAHADERVVHALLRSLAPGEGDATMARVDRAMDALALEEQERFSLRMRRVIAPWLSRGAAAAAMLLLAIVLTRAATTPSAAYAELAAIASATQSVPLRRYAVVTEFGLPGERSFRHHGTIDLGPDGRFVARVAADPDDERRLIETLVDRALADERVRQSLQDRGLSDLAIDGPEFRTRLIEDEAFRERMMRELIRDAVRGPGRERAEASRVPTQRPSPDQSGRPTPGPTPGPTAGQLQDRPRDANESLEGPRRPRGPGLGTPRGQRPDRPHPTRLRPPRGGFDARATIGHDGTEFWLVPAHGPVLTSAEPSLLQGRIELAEGLDQLILDRVLDRLREGYRLERTEVDDLDPDTGIVERVIRIDATRTSTRGDRPGRHHAPSVVTVMARTSDLVVISFEALWIPPSGDGPQRRMAIELLDELPPASYDDLSWFGHDAHHDGDRSIRVFDEQEIAQQRELRSRLRAE